jgi:hypothetical protein
MYLVMLQPVLFVTINYELFVIVKETQNGR